MFHIIGSGNQLDAQHSSRIVQADVTCTGSVPVVLYGSAQLQPFASRFVGMLHDCYELQMVVDEIQQKACYNLVVLRQHSIQYDNELAVALRAFVQTRCRQNQL